uniref:Uncharacterized protein n=1 Tax=Molossus molossus TaxID=27622 RepID=A0A7J8C8E9_MOLMO|nr:hypothetical protein HJG59_009868 [Molossus molossus]
MPHLNLHPGISLSKTLQKWCVQNSGLPGMFIFCGHSHCFYFLFVVCFFLILTRGHFSIFCSDRVGGRERKYPRERDTSSGCHPHDPTTAGDKLQPRYVPLAGTGPQVDALTAEPNRPGNSHCFLM